MFEKLMYISQGENHKAQINNIIKALDCGCKWLQIRYKNRAESEVLELVQEVRSLLSGFKDVTLIINDHPRVALLTEAQGVHLGLLDCPVATARALLGPDHLIGGTANTFEDLLQRISEGCDYIGLGPFRYTPTKANLSPILGLSGYTRLFERLKKEEIRYPPIYAIGGILPEDFDELMLTGIHGIAFSGLLHTHEHPGQLMNILKEKIYATTEYSR